MDKSPDAFRTISEVAELLETPAHVLRFWESRFPQIKPVKRAGGRRYYRPADMALLSGIRMLLHDDGMTIRGVQKILREQGVRYVSGLTGEYGLNAEHPADEADTIVVKPTAASAPIPLFPDSKDLLAAPEQEADESAAEILDPDVQAPETVQAAEPLPNHDTVSTDSGLELPDTAPTVQETVSDAAAADQPTAADQAPMIATETLLTEAAQGDDEALTPPSKMVPDASALEPTPDNVEEIAAAQPAIPTAAEATTEEVDQAGEKKALPALPQMTETRAEWLATDLRKLTVGAFGDNQAKVQGLFVRLEALRHRLGETGRAQRR